jgi:hypothetical protein
MKTKRPIVAWFGVCFLKRQNDCKGLAAIEPDLI